MPMKKLVKPLAWAALLVGLVAMALTTVAWGPDPNPVGGHQEAEWGPDPIGEPLGGQ